MQTAGIENFETQGQATETQWWENKGGFFGLSYLEADDSYDGFVSDNMELGDRTEREVSGVMNLAKIKPGDKLMDLPCGYGRHSLGLGARGVNVTGVDINQTFLDICRFQKLKRNIKTAQFVEKSMLEINFKNEFDAVINMFYSFGFFSNEENVKVTKNFYNALKPGGRFLMHTHVTIPRFEKGLIKLSEARKLKSGRVLELTRRLDPVTSREIGVWTVVGDDGSRAEMSEYSVRIYGTKDYEELCRSVGFSKVDFYGDWQGSPYKEESDLLIAVATK